MKILREWAENDIRTAGQAEAFYKANYNDIPEKSTKPRKPKESKSNVPTWSNPNYVNETDEETRLELERKKQELLAKLDRGMNKMILVKIAGTTVFTNLVALLFITLYHTDALFSMTIATLWTLAYGINLYKENRKN